MKNFTRWLVHWNAKMSLKILEGIDIPHIFHFDMQFRWPRHVHKKIVWKHCQFMVHNNLAWNLPKPEMKRGSVNFPPQTLKSLHGTHGCNWQSQDYKNMPGGVSGQNDWIVPTDECKQGWQINFAFCCKPCLYMRGEFLAESYLVWTWGDFFLLNPVSCACKVSFSWILSSHACKVSLNPI